MPQTMDQSRGLPRLRSSSLNTTAESSPTTTLALPVPVGFTTWKHACASPGDSDIGLQITVDGDGRKRFKGEKAGITRIGSEVRLASGLRQGLGARFFPVPRDLESLW